MNALPYHIKVNSWFAKLAAKKMKAYQLAIVMGNTIHLFNCSKEDFLKNERWLKHELCHVRQFKEHGYYLFIIKYLWEWMRKGYYNNKYEVEARAAELL